MTPSVHLQAGFTVVIIVFPDITLIRQLTVRRPLPLSVGRLSSPASPDHLSLCISEKCHRNTGTNIPLSKTSTKIRTILAQLFGLQWLVRESLCFPPLFSAPSSCKRKNPPH